MVLGAYPHKQEKPRMSFEEPLLEDNGSFPASRSSSEETRYERATSRFSKYRQTSSQNPRRSLIITLAQCIGLSALVLQSLVIWNLWRESRHARALGEINGLVPPVEIKPQRFMPNPEFDPLNATDPEWLSVMPLGGGFVAIDNWQNKRLPPPIQSQGKDLYNVAVFHQLHCLHMLAEEFENLLENRHIGETSTKGTHTGHEEGHGGQDDDLMLWHIRHCFEYIKTSLTCCADTALEGQKSDTDQPATDGFGAYHTCRNFDAVMTWAEENSPSRQGGYPHGTA
ncbi:hypothetical protein F4861DRAFT_95142 [Xylaria intraflava]|nr:hypothetical protein F4861DRAFT_95142 [Xylaria intraflava]